MRKEYEDFILKKLKKNEGKPLGFDELYKPLGSQITKKELDKSLDAMCKRGKIINTGRGYIAAPKNKDLISCKVARIKKTFGFVRSDVDGTEYFVAGRYLSGALPGDSVTVQLYPGKDGKLEGMIVDITEESFSRFTGNIVNEFGELKIVPDTLSKYAMRIEENYFDLREGDKVLAEVSHRGFSHADHRCRVIMSYGSSLKASVCAMSVLGLNGLTPLFPPEVIAEARQVSDYREIQKEIPDRLDLRGLPIFTIDGAATKDIDDAISVSRTENGYRLGVHIADVSHYVTAGSRLDNEAFRRGTSVYYADRVIPMLPQELSNGICSLNPSEDRLAFSCLMELDNNAEITNYRFAKTVIRSRVKGVYSEINELLEGYNAKSLCEKYAEILDCLPLMKELAEKLKGNRIHRGAPQLTTAESELIIDENDYCIDVRPHESGISQEMIEDFMLCANTCAARFGAENGLPFVYRVHEDPPEDRLEYLTAGLKELKIPFNFDKGVKPKALSEILEGERGTDRFPVVNNLVLRSMAKAKYSPEPLGHFGLVLEDYAHFTSPIRRYPDLAIHRIMSDFLVSGNADEMGRKYGKFSVRASNQATETELVAMQTERGCEDCYKAEFLKAHLGDIYEGVIVSCVPHGMYVMLDNTCEGLVGMDSLPYPDYYYDEKFSLKRVGPGEVFTVGKRVRVQIAKADVSSGNVDLEYIGIV